MTKYIWLFGGIALGSCWLLGLVLAGRQPRDTKWRSWWSNALLWPEILDVDKETRNGRIFTGREWLGWLVVALLILVGYLIGSQGGRS